MVYIMEEQLEKKKKGAKELGIPVIEIPKIIPRLAQDLHTPSIREVLAELGRNEHRDEEQTKRHLGEGHSSRIQHVYLVSIDQLKLLSRNHRILYPDISKNLVDSVQDLA